MVNLLLVDTRVDNYNLIVDSVNNDTYVVYINYYVDSLESLLVKISNLGKSTINRMGIIQHNNSQVYFKLVDNMPSLLLNDYSTWNVFVDFLNKLVNLFTLQYLDFMACALTSNSYWLNIFDGISNDTGLKVSGSKDNTGNLSLGGNWFLETGEINLRDFYFTELIDNYNGLLNIYFVNESFTNFTTLGNGWSSYTTPIYAQSAVTSFANNLTVSTVNSAGNRGNSYLYSSSGINTPVFVDFDFTVANAVVGNLNTLAIMLDSGGSSASQPINICSLYLAGRDNRWHLWNKDIANAYYTYNGSGQSTFNRAGLSPSTTDGLNISSRTNLIYSLGSTYNINALLNFTTKQISNITITDKGNSLNNDNYLNLPFVSNSATNVSSISIFGTRITNSPATGTAENVSLNVSLDNFQTYITSIVPTITATYDSVNYLNFDTISVSYTPSFVITLVSDNIDYTNLSITNNASGYISVPLTSNSSNITVSVLGLGTGGYITIDQPASGNYSAGSITLYLDILLGQAIISGNLDTRNLTGPNVFDPSLTTNLGNIVYFSDNTSVATLSGSVITTIAPGQSNIYANVDSNVNYNGNSVMFLINSNPINTIMSNFIISNIVFGTTNVFLNPPLTNSPATINYISSNLLVANIVSNLIVTGNAGTTQITATQNAQGFYTSANITANLTVDPAPTNLDNFILQNLVYQDPPYSINPPTTSRPGTFTYISGNLSVATISGSQIIVGNAGTSLITATIAPTNNYLGNSISSNVIVNKKLPTLNSLVVSPVQKNNTETFTPPTSSTTGLTFSYISANTNIVSVSGNTYSGVLDGKTLITAISDATNNVESANVSGNVISGSNVLTLSPTTNLNGNILVNTANELETYINSYLGDLSNTTLVPLGDPSDLQNINIVSKLQLLNVVENRYFGELGLTSVSSTDVKNYLISKGMSVLANNLIENFIYTLSVLTPLGKAGTEADPQIVIIDPITPSNGIFISSYDNEIVVCYYLGSPLFAFRKLPTNPPTGEIYSGGTLEPSISGGTWIPFPNGGNMFIGGNYYYFLFGSGELLPNLNNIPCIIGDTMVLTKNGYKRADSLKRGDLVITSSGKTVSIQHIQTSVAKGNKHNYPYIVTAGCLDTNYPLEDLKISKNHLIKWGNFWVAPFQIPNLNQDKTNKYITYYHIRLPNYITDHLVVNGGTIIESLGDINNPLHNIENLSRIREKNYYYNRRSLKEARKASRLIDNPQIPKYVNDLGF